MSRDSVDIHQDRDLSRVLARAVDAVARQHFAHDLRRRRLTLQDSQRIAAINAAAAIGDWAVRGLASSANDPTDPITHAKAAHQGLARPNVAHEPVQPQPAQAQPQEARPEQPKMHRSMDLPLTTPRSSALLRIVAVHGNAAAIDGLSDPSRQKKPVFNERRPDELSKNTTERAVTPRPIDTGTLEQFDHFRTRRECAAAAPANFVQHFSIASSISESRNLRHIDEHTEIRATPQHFSVGSPYDRGRNSWPEFGYLRPAATRAQRSSSVELAIDSVQAGFALVTGRGERQTGRRKPLENFDPDGGQIANDGALQTAVGNDPAQGAIAVAADEIEWLRAAVRRSLDELEKVRGSVHPPLPALPPNRGAFRIS